MDGIATPVTLLECRAAGVAAFEAGQSTSDCPHNPYTEEYGAWQRGFGTARYGATQPESIQKETHCGSKVIFARERAH